MQFKIGLRVVRIDERAVLNHPYFAACLAAYISYRGWKRGSLSLSGALAACVVGFVMFSAHLKAFGVAMIVFFFAGSAATRVGKAAKRTLEEGHAAAGNRNARQVLCNSAAALAATVLWTALFQEGAALAALLPVRLADAQLAYTPVVWCAVSGAMAGGWSRFLVFAALGHFACCLGDTFASELGILSKEWPYLVTTLKRVPPGTNGGISARGTAASLGGGVLMGATFAGTILYENAACQRRGVTVAAQCIAWGAVGGLLGSLIDSLLGATVQRTRYSKEAKLILLDDSTLTSEVQVVSGADYLSNNQVNLVSSILTALIVGWLA